MVVLVALGSALAYAVASVMQQYAAVQAPESESLKMSLLLRLATHPIWVIGILADIGGFVLQFIALGHGSLVLVQPLLVCGLLFALPLGALFTRRRVLSLGEWVASIMVCAGLALFLVVASPSHGRSTATNTAWAIVSALTCIPAAIMVLLSRHRSGALRANLQAVAAGLIYGLTAACAKTVSTRIAHSRGDTWHLFIRIVETWQVYGIVVTGIATMVLAQSAFQAGPLGWSLPALTVVDPIVSILVGALAFHEAIAASAQAQVSELVGVGLIVAGVTALARSPYVPQRATEAAVPG